MDESSGDVLGVDGGSEEKLVKKCLDIQVYELVT